ncbi:hypothetical protein Ddye_018930 [Dipteronia dyeriana]|uniref:Uncharacterized protein n=1 Tax=Dipteronia dyeriana TaxID=168575 RepID=A0AAD9TXT7_9ROSI|nr:hypothetical protein Ddye_018930 [Dipteronia dyeriana]
MVSLSLTFYFLLLSHLFLVSSHFNQRVRIRRTRNLKNEEILLRYGPLLVCPDVHQFRCRMRTRMGVTDVSMTWKSRGRVRRVYRWWVLVMGPIKHYPPL